MSDELSAAAWEEPVEVSEVTLKQLDELVERTAHIRSKYEAAKFCATELHNEYEEMSQKVIGLLKATGRTSYSVPGVGNVRFAAKESYRVPPTSEAKRELFKYIQTKYGVETLTEMLSIHAAKINAWANEEVSSNPGLQIPGLDSPTMTETFYLKRGDK